jgi:mono/diheme cytochrome c family protein
MRSSGAARTAMLLMLGLAAASCGPDRSAQIARGRYLVSVIGCSDCHTPGAFSPKPDMSRYLAGSDVAFSMTGVGVFTPPNLTPDKATGLGGWSEKQIVTAITTGVIPSGRILAPIMPWSDFAHLSPQDAAAIAAYLKSLPPIPSATPAPGAPQPNPAGVVFTVAKRPG